ncbi:MAG: non-hydrolyzing UDP-N-acetylglucosamine 2-epimerase [Caldisericaceae bacterium]
MKKVFLVFGTRPEAIKMYPVFKALNEKDDIDTKIIITSQHQEMLMQVIDLFEMPVNYNLNVMEDRQTITRITVKVLEGLKQLFGSERPDMVLVHGDTTTTFAAALASFYEKIPVGHVEAGLRTYNKFSPFPEEMNRRLADSISDLYFAPTARAKEALLREGFDEHNIFVTGNTVVDALYEILKRKAKTSAIIPFNEDEKFIIVTAHRRENWGEPMERICKAIDFLSKKYEGKLKIVFSVHKNPVVRDTVNKILGANSNVKLVEPMDYLDFIYLLSKSFFIMTDSGGIQEEAPSLGKPVLLLRESTERPEAIESGAVKLVGTSFESIIKNSELLIENKDEYKRMSNIKNPFGDGKAGARIADIVSNYLKNGG